MFSLITTSLLWAFSFGLIKHHLGGADPRFVALSRLAMAMLLFLPWLRLRRIGLLMAAELCILGGIQFGLMYLLYLFAFRSLQAHQIALLTITTPIWVCITDDVIQRRFTLRPLLAAAVAIVGTAVIVDTRGFVQTPWRGVCLLQASNGCFALGQVLYRRRTSLLVAPNERALFGWMYVGAVIVVLPFAFATVPEALARLTVHQSWVLAYLGLVASGAGFFLWNHGARQVSAPVLAVMNNVKIPLGVLVSLVCFEESVHLGRFITGSALLLAAVWYARDRASAADP